MKNGNSEDTNPGTDPQAIAMSSMEGKIDEILAIVKEDQNKLKALTERVIDLERGPVVISS